MIIIIGFEQFFGTSGQVKEQWFSLQGITSLHNTPYLGSKYLSSVNPKSQRLCLGVQPTELGALNTFLVLLSSVLLYTRHYYLVTSLPLSLSIHLILHSQATELKKEPLCLCVCACMCAYQTGIKPI